MLETKRNERKITERRRRAATVIMAKFIINTGRKMGPGQEIEDERLITQYLLGELSEEGQAKVQDRLLCDREFFDRLAVEENELMDDYLRGALTRGRAGEIRELFSGVARAPSEAEVRQSIKEERYPRRRRQSRETEDESATETFVWCSKDFRCRASPQG